MKSMLQELVQSTVNVYEESTNETKSMTERINYQIVNGINSLNTMQENIYEMSGAHTSDMNTNIDKTLTKFDQELSVVKSQSNTADSVLTNVSGMVGYKRKFLDSTVTDLCSDVDDAIKKGVNVVDSTLVVAQKVLLDVSNASQNMNETTSKAMNSFTEFIDNKGDVLTNTMQSHFIKVDSHCDIQNNELRELQSDANTHDINIINTKTITLGDTPKKVLISNQTSPFKKTRQHHVIKQTLKDTIYNGDEINYETTSKAIQQLFKPSNSLVIDTNSDVNLNLEEEKSSALATSEDRLSKGSTISSEELNETNNYDDNVDMNNIETLGENANPNINQRQSRSTTGSAKSNTTTATTRISKIKSTTKASTRNVENI